MGTEYRSHSGIQSGVDPRGTSDLPAGDLYKQGAERPVSRQLAVETPSLHLPRLSSPSGRVSTSGPLMFRSES